MSTEPLPGLPPASPPPLPRPGLAPAASETLPYATPEPRGATPIIFHWGLFSWTAAFLAVWLLVMLIVVRKLNVICTDFNVQLSVVTRLAFGVQRFLSAGGWALVAAVPVMLGFSGARMTPGGRRALRTLTALLFGAMVLLTVLGIVAPLTQLVGGLTGSGSGSGSGSGR